MEVPEEKFLDALTMAYDPFSAGILKEVKRANLRETRDDILSEIKQILGPLYHHRSATSAAVDKQALVESLAEKHGS